MGHSDWWRHRLKAVALGLGLAFTALTVRHWSSTLEYGHPPCSDCVADFPQFYAAAKLIWQNPSKLYSNQHQVVIQKALDPRIGETIQPFAYPPFMALVLIPLSWLPFQGAFVLMTLINAALLTFTLFLLIRRLALTKEKALWLWLSTFCNFGVHIVFLQGQTSIIMLSCLTAFMFAVLDGKALAAGFWSACLLFKPQLLAVPMIVLAFQRFWRAFFVATALLAVFCAISVSIVGIPAIIEYLQLLKFYGTSESGFGSYPRSMHNLRALVQYLVPFSYAAYFWLALVIPILCLTMWLNATNRQRAKNSALLWSANFIAAMLIAPHLYPHDLALLVVPSAYILKYCPTPVPWFVPASLILLDVLPVWPFLDRTSVPPLVPLAFLIGFLTCVWSARKSAIRPSSAVATPH